MEPLACYVHPSQPWTTDFGDGIFESHPVPPGWTPVVVTQPATVGTVEISATSWRYSAPAYPAINNGNIADSFQWRAEKEGETPGETQTVPLELCNIA